MAPLALHTNHDWRRIALLACPVDPVNIAENLSRNARLGLGRLDHGCEAPPLLVPSLTRSPQTAIGPMAILNGCIADTEASWLSKTDISVGGKQDRQTAPC
jgi:hypothetical protein